MTTDNRPKRISSSHPRSSAAAAHTAGPTTTVNVVIMDHPGSGADPSTLVALAAALDRQVKEHFSPIWRTSANVRFDTTANPTDWVIGMFRDADQPGALGYHDTTPEGLPLAKIFPLLDLQDGSPLSVTVSHELLEMLGDPYLCLCVQTADGRFWAYENCDAVENDWYLIDNVKVSNFVTPQYFQPPHVVSGCKLDYMDLVKSPGEVRHGGYMQWNDGNGWQQVVSRSSGRLAKPRIDSRMGRRIANLIPRAHYMEDPPNLKDELRMPRTITPSSLEPTGPFSTKNLPIK